MTQPVTTDDLVAMLQDSRARTLALVADLDAGQLIGPRLDIVNPPLWELGHIAWFHEYFVLQNLDGRPRSLPDADALYNSSTVPHDTRWDLPLPSRAATLDYLDRVQHALIERLQARQMGAGERALCLLGLFHEDMHGEALCYTRQTLGYAAPSLRSSTAATDAEAGAWPGDVAIPRGAFQLGSVPEAPFVFDNEKWAHPVAVRPFRIARAPVTNAEFQAFVEDGGYTTRRFWDGAGWAWREAARAAHPVYWVPHGASRFCHRRFDRVEPLPPHQPVAHVNCYEAGAFCCWAGRRLPTEAEWEAAAATEPGGDGISARKRRYPWGDVPPTPDRANLDGRKLGPGDVAAHPEGDSAWGCRQMIGNVWEWTASPFAPYPGFSPGVYADYSAPWFGTHRVLRGGAWATRARMVHAAYRNFFTPERRDIIAGFRTVAL